MSSTQPGTSADAPSLAGPGFFADPYPAYAQLVAAGRPVFDASSNAWLIASYADVDAALRDPRLSKQDTGAGEGPFQVSVLFRDAADHARTRAVLNHAFGLAMAGLDAAITRLVDERIDAILARGRADFIADFAVPFPVDVISQLLGVSPESRSEIHTWSSELVLDADLAPDERNRRLYAAYSAMEQFFRTLLGTQDSATAPGLIGALSRPAPRGEAMTADEILGNCMLLLVAGHETTVNLLGNGMMLLLERPELLARLREDANLIEPFLEEVLRFESPVQRGTFRVTTEPVEYSGVRIEPGQRVIALIGAANRDPSVFTSPDHFDPARKPNPHLAFGMGPHRCVGAMLARMEARIAFTRLLARLPQLRLHREPPLSLWKRTLARIRGTQPTPQPRWRHNHDTRGLRSLEIDV